MSTNPEIFIVFKHISTASYALNVPTLAFWIGLLVRQLISKDRHKLVALTVICVLMILS